MKEFGKMDTSKIEKVKEIISVFEKLNREVLSELEKMLGEELKYWLDDPFTPYKVIHEDTYILEFPIHSGGDIKWLVVKKDGTVVLIDSKERGSNGV